MPPTIQNRKAGRDYFLLDQVEAGIELKGPEVKSLRQGRASLDEAFAVIDHRQAWLINAYIAPYEQANRYNVDPRRRRRLLLHRKEIDRLAGQVNAKGMALVPTKLYFAKGLVKLQLAIGKGKLQHDKRETLKRKTADREIQRAMRSVRR